MRTIHTILVILVFLFNGYTTFAEYRITNVIEVGPADAMPVKWSPDGNTIAYFHSGSLYIADASGNTELVFHSEFPALRYEWLSSYELLVHFKKYRTDEFGPSDYNRLAVIDVTTSQSTILKEYTRRTRREKNEDPNSFAGPWLTVEGRPYVRSDVLGYSKYRDGKEIEFPRSGYGSEAERLDIAENHILSWGEDGLYLISATLDDSTMIAPKPYPHMILPPVLSPDQSHYLHGGTLYRFSDGEYIVMDTIPKDYPEGTGAIDFMYGSFHPSEPEVLFMLIFHDGDQYEVFHSGTFNYETGRFTIIDTLIGLSDCRIPSYSPDGSKIACIAHGIVHIIEREEI